MLTTVPHLKQEYEGKSMQGTHSSRRRRKPKNLQTPLNFNKLGPWGRGGGSGECTPNIFLNTVEKLYRLTLLYAYFTYHVLHESIVVQNCLKLTKQSMITVLVNKRNINVNFCPHNLNRVNSKSRHVYIKITLF